MKTILVPVNFTDVSRNAAKFAKKFAEKLGYEKIVLYNTYETPIPQNSDPMGIISGPLTMYDVQEFKKISEQGLLQLKNELTIDIAEKITIDTISEYGGMSSVETDEICEKIGADLIVTGTSDENFLDDNGSDAINLAKSTNIPLIAVPINCSFKRIDKIVLACDLKKVAETIPVGAIKKILDTTHAKLLVLHIQQNDDDEYLANQKLVLHQQFDAYNPEYHYIKNPEFAEAINSFTESNNIDLIITIPKKHGWLEGLFKTSHLKALAFHSNIPLLMVHD